MVIEFSMCVVCFDNVSWIYSDVVYLSLHIPGSMCVGVTLWFGCGGVVSICSLKHYWPVHVECGGWGLMTFCNSGSLSICFQEHIRYIRYNNPQSAHALHILQNQHKYGQMNSTMTLLKPLTNPSLLLPYEQYYIQSLHQEGKLIPEQSPGETNLLFQTVINPQPPHSTWTHQ